MSQTTAVAERLVQRARADQIAMLFTQWRHTTSSMVLGAGIFSVVMWEAVPRSQLALWFVGILLNQAWRYGLVRCYDKAAPEPSARTTWGWMWAAGSAIAGALWGAAGVAWFLAGDPGHQALIVVCLFGVILGGIKLTLLYKPAFYGFVLTTLLPITLRMAAEADQVHAFLAAVLLVVLGFILRFGHNLNDVLTESLAIRYENVDLIAELQAQTAAADAARTAAEAANRAKTQFLAAASHDLRQPLHAMGLFAAALSGRVKDREVRHLIASINASVEALEQLFSALMDISKLDAGAVSAESAAFPLATLFVRVEQNFAPLAAAKHLRLRVVPTSAWAWSDQVLLERILRNLVANAVRYTSRGGIVLGVRVRGERLWIQVWDSGIGIAEAHRERIFEEFYQLSNAERHSSKGMGLGLAITRRLAALLGHPLRVDSSPGRGSRFTIDVPRAPAIAPPSRAVFAQAPMAASLSGAVIAVIDDEDRVVESMRAFFVQCGASVIGAASGNDIFAALGEAARYPDLIVADYRLMDGELGTEVIQRLREEFGEAIPAVVISGDVSAESFAAIESPPLQILAKPVLPGELRCVAERLLASRRTVHYREQ